MDELTRQAREKSGEVRKNEVAHCLSSKYHRKKSVWIRTAAQSVSAIVGTGIFAGLTSQLGLSGKGSLSIPPGWAWLYWVVPCAVHLCTSPNDPGSKTARCGRRRHPQGKRGRIKSLKFRLEEFLRNSDSMGKEQAESVYQAILAKYLEVSKGIILTPKALSRAADELAKPNNS